MTIPKVPETSIFPAGQSCNATAVPAYTIPNYNCQHVNTIVSGFSGHSNDQPNSKLLNHVCCALVNFQSIQTKSHQVKDYITDHDIDIFFITETWVHDNLRDSLILSAATPPGYAYLSFPRLNRRGGGIAVFHKKCLKINLLKEHHSDACEAIELAVKLGSNQLNVVIVYRAPSLSFRLFLDLMRDIFGRLVTSSQRRLLCVGDFNIHMDNEHDHKTKSFKSMLDEFGLKQHVNVPTHKFWTWSYLISLIQICYLKMVLYLKGMLKVTISLYVSTSHGWNHQNQLNPLSTEGGKHLTKKHSRQI